MRQSHNADHGNAASELGQPLLQLLLVVVGSGLFDLGLDLGNSCLSPAEVEGRMA